MLFGNFVVSGRSMEPVFCAGDRLLVLNFNRFLKAGDVVVVKNPRDSRLVLKRIVNFTKGAYWVEGDNKILSTDSRHFGPVESKDILGRLLCRYWSKR